MSFFQLPSCCFLWSMCFERSPYFIHYLHNNSLMLILKFQGKAFYMTLLTFLWLILFSFTTFELFHFLTVYFFYQWNWFTKLTRILWLNRRIIRKQLDIMPTYHYVQNQGKLTMQSQENDQKSQFGHFLTISGSNISKFQFFLKNACYSNWRSYLVLTSGQKPNQ